MKDLPSLTVLTLDYIPLFDGDMACFRLGGHTHTYSRCCRGRLNVRRLHNNCVLVGFSSLQLLSLRHCHKLTDKCLSYLTGLTALTFIDVTETDISLFHVKRFLSKSVAVVKKSGVSQRKLTRVSMSERCDLLYCTAHVAMHLCVSSRHRRNCCTTKSIVI